MQTLGLPTASPDAFVRAIVPGERRWRRSELGRLARAIGTSPELWRPLVRHDPTERFYTLLHWQPNVDVWLLGWAPGQSTSLHDHGGVWGAFYVAEGELTEELTDGPTAAGIRTARCVHGTTRSFGPLRVHDVANQTAAPASSVHVYSPPIPSMTFFGRDDRAGLVPLATRYRASAR